MTDTYLFKSFCDDGCIYSPRLKRGKYFRYIPPRFVFPFFRKECKTFWYVYTLGKHSTSCSTDICFHDGDNLHLMPGIVKNLQI